MGGAFLLTKFIKRNKNIHIPTFTKTDLVTDALPETVHDIVNWVQLTPKDIENLRLIDDLMNEHVEVIAERHYEMIMDIAEVKEIFNEFTTYDRYMPAIIDYFKQLTNPKLDNNFIQSRKKIGVIHSKIKLTEEWYIGSYMRLYEYLIPHIALRYANDSQLLAGILSALNRIITFDTILVLQAYKEMNDSQLIENVSDAMDEITKIDEVGNLIAVVEETAEEATEMNKATKQLNTSVDEIAMTAHDASERTGMMVGQANDSKQLVETSLTGFLTMIDEFQESKESFEALTEKMNSISEVVELIKGIADETNLLALNASIEAARAGEHGLGFAVVAEEVRNLAEQTKTSVEDITKEMMEVQHESHTVSASIESFANNLSKHVNETNVSMQAIEQIMEHIDNVNEAIATIASITESEADVAGILSDKMNMLQDRFEHARHLSMVIGKSVYASGQRVNNIRQTALVAVRTPTEEQQKRMQKTESRVKTWFEHYEAQNLINK